MSAMATPQKYFCHETDFFISHSLSAYNLQVIRSFKNIPPQVEANVQ